MKSAVSVSYECDVTVTFTTDRRKGQSGSYSLVWNMRGPTFSLNLLCQRSVFDNLACVIFLVSMAIAQLVGRSIKVAAACLNDFCQHTSASSSFFSPLPCFS